MKKINLNYSLSPIKRLEKVYFDFVLMQNSAMCLKTLFSTFDRVVSTKCSRYLLALKLKEHCFMFVLLKLNYIAVNKNDFIACSITEQSLHPMVLDIFYMIFINKKILILVLLCNQKTLQTAMRPKKKFDVIFVTFPLRFDVCNY